MHALKRYYYSRQVDDASLSVCLCVCVCVCVCVCEQTPLNNDKIYFVVYKTGCHLVFRAVGPLLVLTVLNCCLAQSLRHLKRRHQRITGTGGAAGGGSFRSKLSPPTRRGGGGGRQRENITAMVVAVIFVFIVCELPDVALRLLAVTAAAQLQVR